MPEAPAIPHSRPCLGAREAEAAAAVIAGGAVAQGRQVTAFEEEVAGAVGRRYGVAVSSGTAALHLGLQVLLSGAGEGRRVLLPSYVCAALVQATRAAAAAPHLVDVDGDSGNLDEPPDAAACAAAIVPHMFGRRAAAVDALAQRLPVVEDLAMALGSDGVGTRGVLAICSFYATKVITSAGEGGMVLTDDEGLARQLRELRDYDGRGLDAQRWNYKLTDVAAAVGRVQVARLPELIRRRRELAARYDEALRDLPVRRPPPVPGSNEYRYVLCLEDEGIDVEHAMRDLQAQGVAARRPVPQPLHRGLGLRAEDFGGAERMWRQALSLPLYPALTDAEAERVARAAGRVLGTPVATTGGG